MRISDWSSDVCSSDLHRRIPARVGHQRRTLGHLVADVPEALDVLEVGFAEVVPDAGVWWHDVRLVAAVADHIVRALDRKSVVSGQSVSVRVDLGGRRIYQIHNSKHRYSQSRQH